MKNFMLAFAVLVTAVSIGWALNQPETPIVPEEDNGSSEVVLEVFSSSDIETYGSYFNEFSSISSVKLVNISQSTAALRVDGILTSTNSAGTAYRTASDCGDCWENTEHAHITGYYNPNGDCWHCTTTPNSWAIGQFDLGDWIGML